jgi:hypothetical protein
MRLRPYLNAHHLGSVSAMAAHLRQYGGLTVWAVCDTCGERREIDIHALNGRVPWGYCLINRRCPCKLTPGCGGWNVFEYRDGKGPNLPLFDLWAQARWAGVTLPTWHTV